MGNRRYPTRFPKALAISIIAAVCSLMAVPASAMPNMPHLFAKHEVATCGGASQFDAWWERGEAHPSSWQL